MNWRKLLNRDSITGILLGVVTPLLFVPVVLLLISWMEDYHYSILWTKFKVNDPYRIKIITLSILSNLIWFYYFLNKERYDTARGIIIGCLIYAPYVIYIKFF